MDHMAIYELLGAELGQLPIHLFFMCKSEKLARQAQVIRTYLNHILRSCMVTTLTTVIYA